MSDSRGGQTLTGDAGDTHKTTMEKDSGKQQQGSTVALIKSEINRQLADAETMKSLLETTFKGLDAQVMKRALLEGMVRGFEFKDFLEKNIYAIPYGQTYSLVASIDHFRKIGARSGVVGVDAPKFEYGDDGNAIVSCSITVKKRFPDGYIGEFTAEVDFREYSTGKNLWASKPKTMIAKVAEMHALRKACPEQLAQVYVEEEFDKKTGIVEAPMVDLDFYRAAIKTAKDMATLERVWADVPGDARATLREDMEAAKAVITSAAESEAV